MRTRLLWAAALGVSLLLTVRADFRGGYVGPDYSFHILRMIFGRIFDFSMADPPIFVMLGYGALKAIGEGKGGLITLTLMQAVLNAVALWYFFLRTERYFKSPLLHLALVFFLTFLPVRNIHSITIGTDWMTIPAFVLVLYLFERVLSEKSSTISNRALLSLALMLAVWSKFSFMALLPAIFVVFVFYWWRDHWNWQRFVTTCALCLVLPSALVLYSRWESSHVSGAMAQTIWRTKDQPADMNFTDLLLPKRTDILLFEAPEAFRSRIGEPHRHSYLALSHYGIFTDPMNLFQHFPKPWTYTPGSNPNDKVRSPWKTPVMAASMSLGVIWTFFALIGTAWALFRAIRHLWRAALEREDSAMLLGMAFFLLMFLPIPFVYRGAMYGFWTPRLILPSLLCFSLAAFLFLDQKFVKDSRAMAGAVMFLVVVQCALEFAIMV